MPSTTKAGSDTAPKQQAASQPMFDETPPAPPAAEQPTGDPAASSDDPVDDSPEGIEDVQEASPPADPAPVAPADGAADEQSSVAPEEVRLGQVIGLLHRAPLGDVLASADEFAEKIEALTFTAQVQDLQKRMRVSEGRCAPIYFTMDDDGEREFLIAGDDALSAAKAIGLETVFVVMIHPGDAGAVQSYLAGKAGTSASTEDDELVWRANGYHSDS